MTYQDSNRLPANRKLLARLFSSIRVSTVNFFNGSACWEWTKSKDKDGYGKTIYTHSVRVYQYYRAHRLFYDLFVEIIPNHLVTDHLCRNVSCCNPAHLEAVTVQVNTLRGNAPSAYNATKTHCLRGHLYTAETCLPRSNKRDCRVCARILENARRRIRRAALLP